MAIQAHLYPNNNLGFPLCGSQDLMMIHESNVGLAQSCFNSQHKHHQRNPNMLVDNLNPTTSSMPNISQALALQFQKQTQDIDRYIKLQNEKLRMMLQEQRKQQVVTMVKKVESDTIYLMRQKEEEIEQARKKKVELEEFVRRLEEENEAWKKVAQEKEAMVLSLHNTLNNINNNVGLETDDAGSCCNGEREQKKMICKSCDYGKACFLFLPCRHVCSCKDCEPLLQDCPLCGMSKKASIEIRDFDFLG